MSVAADAPAAARKNAVHAVKTVNRDLIIPFPAMQHYRFRYGRNPQAGEAENAGYGVEEPPALGCQAPRSVTCRWHSIGSTPRDSYATATLAAK
jgi:hypothetical protein